MGPLQKIIFFVLLIILLVRIKLPVGSFISRRKLSIFRQFSFIFISLFSST